MPQPANKPLLILILALLTAAVSYLALRAPKRIIAVDSGRFMVMGTFGQIRLRCRDEQTGRQALTAAHAALARVDLLMSTYRDDSELSRVNQGAATAPIDVSPETFDLLTRSLDYSRLSQGAFDITVPPLLQLWKQAVQQDQEPDPQQIADTLQRVGYDHVELIGPPDQRGSVRFLRPGMALNVDAIAKGYGVDCALEATRLPGVTAALVEIGGEIACFGDAHTDGGWLIGIQDPFASDLDNQLSQFPRWVLRLRNCAVATSGNYRRYSTIAGKKFSHIVDPRTGRPTSALPSVTIIAPTATDADALATVVSVLGLDKGMPLIESLDATEALLVTGDPAAPQERTSPGFYPYQVPQ